MSGLAQSWTLALQDVHHRHRVVVEDRRNIFRREFVRSVTDEQTCLAYRTVSHNDTPGKHIKSAIVSKFALYDHPLQNAIPPAHPLRKLALELNIHHLLTAILSPLFKSIGRNKSGGADRNDILNRSDDHGGLLSRPRLSDFYPLSSVAKTQNRAFSFLAALAPS